MVPRRGPSMTRRRRPPVPRGRDGRRPGRPRTTGAAPVPVADVRARQRRAPSAARAADRTDLVAGVASAAAGI